MAIPAAVSCSFANSKPSNRMTLSAPHAPSSSKSTSSVTMATGEAPRSRAAPRSSRVNCGRPGSTITPISGSSIGATPRTSPRSRSSSWLVSSAPRSVSTATAAAICSSSVASVSRRPGRVEEMWRVSPTQVGLAFAPHGPGPSSAAVTRRMRLSDTAARPAGSTLHGSINRSAVDTIAGNATRSCAQPSSYSARMSSMPSASVRCRAPVTNGRSSRWASSGPTCPVSASTEFRPTSTRSKDSPSPSAAESARAVARVSDPANAGSVIRTPSISTSRSSPQATASRRLSSAAGGPSVNTVTVACCSAARATACATARRQ